MHSLFTFKIAQSDSMNRPKLIAAEWASRKCNGDLALCAPAAELKNHNVLTNVGKCYRAR